MTRQTNIEASGERVRAEGPLPAQGSAVWSASFWGLNLAVSIGVLSSLILFYTWVYSIHPDLAGGILSGRLAMELGDSFAEYSLYFPPAERTWFTLAAWISNATGLAPDLTAILLTGVAMLFSGGLGYQIRRQTVGATPLFLIGSIAVILMFSILLKNVVGLREHMVVLGLWPYLVLRLSDPENAVVGWKTRLVLGAWMGATLLFKYLYSLVVLLVELADAAMRRRPLALLRIENLISGAIVATYLLVWLVLDPAQREAISTIVGALDANLTDPVTNLQQSAIRLALAVFLVVVAHLYKVPKRVTAIGMALVVGAVIAAAIQSRWYSHHLYPITIAYIAWWWMISRQVKWLWLVAIAIVLARPVIGEFINTQPYQNGVREAEQAMSTAGVTVAGKRVGILIMNPSPFNQYLVSQGALRWNASVNNSYVAAELDSLDIPENAGLVSPPISLGDPARQYLHDEMLRLWEDMPPDALILDQSTNWPLLYVDVEWRRVFAEDPRFQAVLEQYRPVFEHKGEQLEFQYLERIE